MAHKLVQQLSRVLALFKALFTGSRWRLARRLWPRGRLLELLSGIRNILKRIFLDETDELGWVGAPMHFVPAIFFLDADATFGARALEHDANVGLGVLDRDDFCSIVVYDFGGKLHHFGFFCRHFTLLWLRES